MVSSRALVELIEPTLASFYGVKGVDLGQVLSSARTALLKANDELREARQEVHLPSFELGVATTFSELLGSASQRNVLNNAIRDLELVHCGIQILHELGLISRSLAPATQRGLAEHIGIDRGNFNRRIRRLEEIGVVESKRQGQSLVYSLTPLGIDALNELRPGWKALHPKTLEVIESENQATIVASELIFERLLPQIRKHDLSLQSTFEQSPSRRSYSRQAQGSVVVAGSITRLPALTMYEEVVAF